MEAIKLIVQRIKDGVPLDSSTDYQIYIEYKEVIHLLIKKEKKNDN